MIETTPEPLDKAPRVGGIALLEGGVSSEGRLLALESLWHDLRFSAEPRASSQQAVPRIPIQKLRGNARRLAISVASDDDPQQMLQTPRRRRVGSPDFSPLG